MKQKSKVLDLNREVSLALLRYTQCFAVRTPKGQKDPGVVRWDPSRVDRETSNRTIATLETTQDNLGIHLFGHTIDVDIDTDNPFVQEALDFFLPATAHMWGRASRPNTHRLYELHEQYDPNDFPFLSKIAAHDVLKVEVRGGEQRSGRYSLLPGSLHPSGEMYEWASPKAAQSTPVQVGLFSIMDAIRKALVVAMLAPYWQEGVRNELCKALSGFMFRASQHTEHVGMPFDRTSAEHLLRGLIEVGRDSEEDIPARLKTLEQTWEKGESGNPVTGATRIVELTGDPEILPLLYSLLAHTPEMQQLDELFEQYAVIRNTSTFLDLTIGAKGNFSMSKDAFITTLGGYYLTTPRGKVAMSTIFMNSLNRQVIDRLSLDPTQPTTYTDKKGAKVANLWSGWGIDPWPEAVSEDDVAPFLGYVKEVIANRDEKMFDWVIQWLAQLFQEPTKKPGTALVLVGQPGAGKSFLPENILRPIIGDAHFAKASTTERLTSKFNKHMSGRLLIQGEEVMNSNRRVDAEALKDMITSRMRTIEPKGQDSFEMEDLSRYIFTSNHVDNAVHIGEHDRRYTVAHVNNKYAYDDTRVYCPERNEFWGKMAMWAEDETNLAKLHKYFLSVEVNERFIREPLDTDAKRSMRLTSSKGMDAWLASLVEMTNPLDNLSEMEKGDAHSFVLVDDKLEHTEEWPDFVHYAQLEKAMTRFAARDYGERRSAQQIAKHFKDNGLIGSTESRFARRFGKKVRVRVFPTRPDILEYLKYRGIPVLDTPEPEKDKDDNPRY
tara:strand:+ start:599 stop:2929 length:2331 start_codon:yes stop_codon:yes gene_type:complete